MYSVKLLYLVGVYVFGRVAVFGRLCVFGRFAFIFFCKIPYIC